MKAFLGILPTAIFAAFAVAALAKDLVHQETVDGDNQIHDDAPAISPRKAPQNCNAFYSDIFSRTNSKYLAVTTVQNYHEQKDTVSLTEFLQNLQNQQYNMDTGFYPFVINRTSTTMEAHGLNAALQGRSLRQVFDCERIGFANTDDLLRRLLEATDRGGDFVQYLWAGRSGANRSNTCSGETSSTKATDEEEGEIIINSKMAYVLDLTEDLILGVGYENKQLPPDVPCSAKYDAFCSMTNVRSLVGKAQFRLEQAASLENLEVVFYELSLKHDLFTIDQGCNNGCRNDKECCFYTFVFKYDGRLVSHALQHKYFGKTLAEMVVGLLKGTEEEGMDLHRLFKRTADEHEKGIGNGFVQYRWRNSLNEESYTKIAYVTKFEFGGESYYVGSGFRFAMDDMGESSHDETEESTNITLNNDTTVADVDDTVQESETECKFVYNFPSTFKTALKLLSHSISHIISSATSLNEAFQVLSFISGGENFRLDDLYTFVYDFDGTCVAHGLFGEFVNRSLHEVFETLGIELDSKKLHEEFKEAATKGGAVSYKWHDPCSNSTFEKISFLFQLNINGRPYYAGVGFENTRAPVYAIADDKEKTPCSSSFGVECSTKNALAILGQVLANITLATSPAYSSNDESLGQVLKAINEQDEMFRYKDFSVSVFSTSSRGITAGKYNTSCATVDDGSGCCIADGFDHGRVGKSWQQILAHEGINSPSGIELHNSLVSTSESWSEGDLVYSYGRIYKKRAHVERFSYKNETFYVVTEYINREIPYHVKTRPVALWTLSLLGLLSLVFVFLSCLPYWNRRDNPYDVFLIHTDEQRESVDALKKKLEAQDLSCFLDRDMLGNRQPNSTMENALAGCRHVVVVISRTFLTRPHPCSELQYAFEKFEWLKREDHWHSLFVVLYDLKVRDYKKVRITTGFHLPNLPNNIQIEVLNDREDWGSLCGRLKTAIQNEDQGRDANNRGREQNEPWSGALAKWGAIVRLGGLIEMVGFPQPERIYTAVREETGCCRETFWQDYDNQQQGEVIGRALQQNPEEEQLRVEQAAQRLAEEEAVMKRREHEIWQNHKEKELKALEESRDRAAFFECLRHSNDRSLSIVHRELAEKQAIMIGQKHGWGFTPSFGGEEADEEDED
eukprot:CAMPEP_0172455376 /NCGR_PEP_ID=MMETSP1065-20121228/12035_1 /TAXON_ID=265537 /ORGANISM="Amphiprora paludosa, Strain CCMP125" /LENGTH=1132 /DNA_ID=CAMNT_0013207837 /DNA_START=63 /DNA_END=3461 /DNA_ORIENTATION=+